MKKNQKGFSVVEGLLIFVIIGIIAGVGWFVWDSNKKTGDSLNNVDNSQTSNQKIKNNTQVETLKLYKNDEYGFSFDYPETWKLTEDLGDGGRGSKEGDVYITSTNGTKITFNLNQGGKGGDCLDEQINDRSARTCYTVNTLSVDELPIKTGYKKLYFYQANSIPPKDVNEKTEYFIGLSTDDYGVPKVGSDFTPISMVLITNKKGSVQINIEGKNDDKNGTIEFFDTQEIKEATPILKSILLASD